MEYVRLLHNIYAYNIDNHSWRGYIVLDKMQKCSIKEIQACKNDKRPVWFIFSGIDSQWFGLGMYIYVYLRLYICMLLCHIGHALQ